MISVFGSRLSVSSTISLIWCKNNVSCLKQGTKTNKFCLKQASGNECLGGTSTQTSLECPPGTRPRRLMAASILIETRRSGFFNWKFEMETTCSLTRLMKALSVKGAMSRGYYCLRSILCSSHYLVP